VDCFRTVLYEWWMAWRPPVVRKLIVELPFVFFCKSLAQAADRTTEEPWCITHQGQNIFSSWAVGPTQPAFHCVRGNLPPRVTWLGREADRLRPMLSLRMFGVDLHSQVPS